MLKKIFKFSISLYILFLFIINVSAYEFVDPKNESKVNDKISEIYDAKEQYEDLAGHKEEEEVEIKTSTSTSYWWPIGSVDTVESGDKVYATGDPEAISITSDYGSRVDPITGIASTHSGVDISGGRGLGKVNVIAAKDGIVVYPTKNVSNNCVSGGSTSCGSGYGNYVIIQHSNGTYTLYGHLYENSITVKAGDQVEQGQVIGKMGSSGYSTGAHLHFEVRVGNNSTSSTENPLNYISADNPREVSTNGGQLWEFLNSWEGGDSTKVGDSYRVLDIGDGERTVGHGVTLRWNSEKFQKYGIDVTKYGVGSTIPIDIVDNVERDIIEGLRSELTKGLVENSITLEENQIEAVISWMYNKGTKTFSDSNFYGNYKKYGNTEQFRDNWFFYGMDYNSQFTTGWTRRRNAEWSLFHEGVYVFNR